MTNIIATLLRIVKKGSQMPLKYRIPRDQSSRETGKSRKYFYVRRLSERQLFVRRS